MPWTCPGRLVVVMLSLILSLLPLLCYAQQAAISQIFEVHAPSCQPHHEELDLLWRETHLVVEDGNENIKPLIETPIVDPNSDWYQDYVGQILA